MKREKRDSPDGPAVEHAFYVDVREGGNGGRSTRCSGYVVDCRTGEKAAIQVLGDVRRFMQRVMRRRRE